MADSSVVKSRENIKIDTACYPLEAIFATLVAKTDKFYFYLGPYRKRNKIIALSITPKNRISHKRLKREAQELLNDLAENTLRFYVSKKNAKIREFIVKEALFFSQPYKLLEEAPPQEAGFSFNKDPLGIAKPWEAKA